MRTYQIESVIDEHGIIVLPDGMKNLQKHRVKLIIVDLEAGYADPVDFLGDITDKYSNINEDDLIISEIYQQRETVDARQIMFD